MNVFTLNVEPPYSLTVDAPSLPVLYTTQLG